MVVEKILPVGALVAGRCDGRRSASHSPLRIPEESSNGQGGPFTLVRKVGRATGRVLGKAAEHLLGGQNRHLPGFCIVPRELFRVGRLLPSRTTARSRYPALWHERILKGPVTGTSLEDVDERGCEGVLRP